MGRIRNVYGALGLRERSLSFEIRDSRASIATEDLVRKMESERWTGSNQDQEKGFNLTLKVSACGARGG
jgi:hypothetical protein